MAKSAVNYVLKRYQEFLDAKEKSKESEEPLKFTKSDLPYLVLASIIKEAADGTSETSIHAMKHEAKENRAERKHNIISSMLGHVSSKKSE